jgi:hypothetical protein
MAIDGGFGEQPRRGGPLERDQRQKADLTLRASRTTKYGAALMGVLAAFTGGQMYGSRGGGPQPDRPGSPDTWRDSNPNGWPDYDAGTYDHFDDKTDTYVTDDKFEPFALSEANKPSFDAFIKKCVEAKNHWDTVRQRYAQRQTCI